MLPSVIHMLHKAASQTQVSPSTELETTSSTIDVLGVCWYTHCPSAMYKASEKVPPAKKRSSSDMTYLKSTAHKHSALREPTSMLHHMRQRSCVRSAGIRIA